MIGTLANLSRKHLCMALAITTALAAPAALAFSPAAAVSSDQSAERSSYVLFTPGSSSITMSGSTDDIARARAARAGNEGLLYVRHGRTAYAIRDAATLRQARALFEPQEVLGARQAQLGSRQAALGHRQAQLGAEQARLGRLQANASPRGASELGRQQNELGRRQGELGRQQGELGRQQGELGREQARLARIADERLRALVADAVQRGIAQRVD